VVFPVLRRVEKVDEKASFSLPAVSAFTGSGPFVSTPKPFDVAR
jgi:hypothetical protein